MNRLSRVAAVLTAALAVLVPRTATSELADPIGEVVVHEGSGNGLVSPVVFAAVMPVAITVANRIRKRLSL